MNIKEIRNTTGLSQRSFSKMFNIPISTLQKWEQGESSPTPYIIKLIANQLPIENDNMRKMEISRYQRAMSLGQASHWEHG